MISGTARSCSGGIEISRRLNAVCIGVPVASICTPQISAQAPRSRSAAYSSAPTASATVEWPGIQAPMLTIAIVRSRKRSIARASSGCARSERAVSASGTIIGA